MIFVFAFVNFLFMFISFNALNGLARQSKKLLFKEILLSSVLIAGVSSVALALAEMLWLSL